MEEERRQNSKNLLREMQTRAQGWSALERLAILDMLGTLVVREGGDEGMALLDQQWRNIARKSALPPAGQRPALVPQVVRPEAGGAVPSGAAGCSPKVVPFRTRDEDDFVDAPANRYRMEPLA